MTVQELIDALSTYAPDANVKVWGTANAGTVDCELHPDIHTHEDQPVLVIRIMATNLDRAIETLRDIAAIHKPTIDGPRQICHHCSHLWPCDHAAILQDVEDLIHPAREASKDTL